MSIKVFSQILENHICLYEQYQINVIIKYTIKN